MVFRAEKIIRTHQSDLYQIVYGVKLLRVMVCAMMLFFVVHPVMPALAAEEVAEESVESEVVDEQMSEPEMLDESITLADAVENEEVEEIVAEDDQEAQTTNVTTAALSNSEEETIEKVVESVPQSASSEDTAADDATNDSPPSVEIVETSTTNSSSAPETNRSSSSVATGDANDVSEVEHDTDNSATTTEESDVVTGVVDAVTATEFAVSTTTATSTTDDLHSDVVDSAAMQTENVNDEVSDTQEEDAAAEVPPAAQVAGVATSSESTTTPEVRYVEVTGEVMHTNDSYNFTRSACTSMGDGGYYCFDDTRTITNERAVEVFVQLDNDADRELYYRDTQGVVTQLTFNTVDDTAPSYDPVSDTVVWQRLEGGRYNIYTKEDGEERRLSLQGVNNMEPHRSGEMIVWQSWQHDNWEVVLYEDGEEKVISNSSAHDIAPHIQGEYVIWSTTSGEETIVSVYDTVSRKVSVIKDSEGGRVENPRFVLMYDAKYANGDVVTMGFDTETGEAVPLAAQPAAPPPTIPDSDQTGETRALIQNKSSSREDVDEEVEPVDYNDELLEDTEVLVTDRSTTSTDGVGETTITLKSPTSATDNETLPLTDFDLIVEPFSSTSKATSTQ